MNPEINEREDAKRIVRHLKKYSIVLSTVHKSLITTVRGNVYQEDPKDWEFLPHRLELCELLAHLSIHFGICSNEGGVGYGYFSGPEMVQELWTIGNRVHAKSVQYCMYVPGASDKRYVGESSKRFPGYEMLQDSLLEMNARLCSNFYPSDILLLYSLPEEKQAGKDYGIHTLQADRFFTPFVYECLQEESDIK